MFGGPPHPQTDQDRKYLRTLFPYFEKFKDFPADFRFPLSENNGSYAPPNNTLACFIAGMILCGLTIPIVVMRLWIRGRRGFGTDDWVMLVSFIFYNLYGVGSIYTVFGTGLGYHIYDLSALDIRNYLIMIPVLILFLWVSINLSRCSLLHLFLRLSHLQSPHQVLFIRSLLTLSYIFIILSIMAVIFECGLPISGLVNLHSYFDGTCAGTKTIAYHGSFVAVNLLLDALTIFPPIVILVGTPLARGKKINLIFLLILGVLTMVMGALRIYVFWQWNLDSFDITWHSVLVAVGGTVEGSLSAIIACLPVLNQKFIQIYRKVFGTEETARSKIFSTRLITSIFERVHATVSPMKSLLSSSDATAPGGNSLKTSNSDHVDSMEEQPRTITVTTLGGLVASQTASIYGIQQDAINNNNSDQGIIFHVGYHLSEEQNSDLESQAGEVDDNLTTLSTHPRARVHFSGRRPSSPTISGAASLNTP